MKHLTILFLVPVLISLTSCDETQTDLQSNVEAATEYVFGEVTYLDIFNYVDKAMQDPLLLSQGYATIDSANITLLAGGLGATLDFGSGVECPDGKYRSGSINISLTGYYFQDTVSGNISLQNLTVEGRSISGNLLIAKDFSGAFKDMTFEIVGGTYSDSLGNVSSFESVQTLRWTAGANTFGNTADDIYTALTGSTAEGLVYNGQEFSATVTSDLVFNRSCQWISQGMLSLSMPGALVSSGTIDFGTGDCDSKVIFTFGESSFPYYMD